MEPALYLINPKTDFPVYYGSEAFQRRGFEPAAFVADLTIATVSALVPPEIPVTLCDEAIAPVDFDHPAPYVGITGKSSQRKRMITIAEEFRKRGKTVIMGGPFATLSPASVRPYCDILVRGEFEGIAGRFFDDLHQGILKAEYSGGRSALSQSPPPRWDLYPNHRALQGCLQTSRGCPYNCEFCDTIQYVGRRQRHKPTAAVLAELDTLYRIGYRTVFLADDNFTAHRGRARVLLQALRAWNDQAAAGPVRFATQLSIDAGDDPDLLALMASAGLGEAFVGIETPSRASLIECGKRQNLGPEPAERLRRFVEHGIGIIGGLIVGFDADTPEIFRQQYEFAMQTPVPTFSVNALIAPPSTPLYDRMEHEGRLLPESETDTPQTPWWTNFSPKQFSRKDLQTGLSWLVNRLNRPSAFEERVLRFIDYFPDREPPHRTAGVRRAVGLESVSLVRAVRRLGETERGMFERIMTASRSKPATGRHVFADLFRYMQIRTMFAEGGLWDPAVGKRAQPYS